LARIPNVLPSFKATCEGDLLIDYKVYEQFFDALEKIVNENKSVAEKAEALHAEAGQKDLTNLLELNAWTSGWD
jgi:hypothetical protein